MSAGAVGAAFEIEDFVDSLLDDGFDLSLSSGGLPHASGPAALDDERAHYLSANAPAIARYLAAERVRARLAGPIMPRTERDRVPLSAQQHALWLSLSLGPDALPTYHTPTLLRLAGPLDIARLEAALSALLARHEAFRTIIVEEDGTPYQRVCVPSPVTLDIAEVAPDALPAAIQRIALAPISVDRGPFVRAVLFRHGPADHTLLILQHHLVSDGWTIALLARELGLLYSDGPGALAAPRLQYADYALWQREALAGDAIAPLAQDWADTLSGWSPLELPTDRPRAGARCDGGDHHHFHIPRSVVAGLERLARGHRTTLFSVVAAAFVGLLRIHARQSDVTILTAVAGRSKRELADMAGYFVNLLPLRDNTEAGSEAFTALLDRVAERLADAQSAEIVPFADIVRHAGIAREASGRTALERAVLVFQSASAGPAPRFAGLDVNVDPEADLPIAKFELTFSLTPTEDGLAGRAEFATDLYDRATIERLSAHLGRLLEAFAAEPGALVCGSTLLTPAAFEATVLAPNRTATSYPREATLSALFEAVAAAYGDTVAVRDEGVDITYAALSSWADRIAATLHARGMISGPEPMIALRMARGAPLLAAILGVLKAGAAYVPIDPLYPAERARRMIEETRAGALLVATRTDEAEAIATGTAPLLALDTVTDAPDGTAFPPRTADDLAYVCFTSGTTGMPKGVLVPQRAVVRLVRGSNVIAPAVGERIAFASNAVFDAATLEIWGALLNGATLVVVSHDTLLDPDALADCLADEQVDYLWLTAALFDQMAAHRPDMFAGLKALYAGGSALDPDSVRAVFASPAGAPQRVVNGYGPTENTTFSTIHPITHLSPDARAVPIGRPISNALAFVLDETGRPVPEGVLGELHVGGDGLARAYLNDPDATARKFAEHVFTHPVTGETFAHRLYATGDLVRWRDGSLDFMGRMDRQVKLHGFRVEPGEIEAAMGEEPALLQQVVRILHDADGHPRLVAWYTCRPGRAVEPADLRARLERTLPAYMVPSAFVPLERMPVNTSGKIDLGALPPPTSSAAPNAATAVPDDDVAARVLAIWRSVLRSDAIGVDDDFFSVGGDSILTIQVVARCREAGLHFAPRDIFEARTVARLARRLADMAPAAASAAVPDGPPLLTPIQRWFFGLDLAEPAHFNQAFLLVPPGAVSLDALGQAVATLAARHDALRQRFAEGPDGWRVEIAPPDAPNLAHIAAIAATPEESLQDRLTALQAGLDPHSGPLVAAALVSGAADGAPRILLAIHHLAVDIVSWRILVGELAALLAHHGAPLPAPTAPFAAWSRALDAAATRREVAETRPFWATMLEAAGPLPTADASSMRAEPRSMTLRLDRPTSRALLRECADAYRTRTDELILAAFAPALAAACGAPDASIILEGHGREAFVGPDVSSTVGWFTTRFPVRFAAIGSSGTEEAILTVKETMRRIPHNGLSYGLVRDGLAAREPDVLFNYLGQLDSSVPDGWALAQEPPGAMVSPRNRPASALDVTAVVIEECLEFRFVDDGRAPEGWVARLADAVETRLRAVVAHCRGRRDVRLLPGDFPHVTLTRPELDAILAHPGSAPEDIAPLTPLQEGLLFHALHSPQSDQYIVQFAWECAAALDPERMRAAWDALAAATPALRTRFAWEGLDAPVQVIEREGNVAFRVVDLAPRIAHGQSPDAALDEVRAADRARGIDLSEAGAFRVTLVRRAADDWVMVWTHHHIIMDGWSVPLLMDALGAFYAGTRAPAEPARHAAYAAALRARDTAAALDYWRETLDGIEGPTDLAIARQGATLGKHRPIATLGEEGIVLEPALSARLAHLARTERVTLNAVIQLAFAHVLGRYAGREGDTVFGTIVSGRNDDFAGIEGVIGLVANVVPLRIRGAAEDRVSTALRDAHHAIEMASRHASVSLADIEASLHLPPDAPLFHAATVFENYPDVGGGSAVLGAGAPRVTDKTSFPLLLMALPGEALTLKIQFDSDLFDPASIAAMLGHLANVLDAFAGEPEARLADIDILGPRERQALVEDVNATAWPVDPDATIVNLFAAQLAARPDAIAIEDDAGDTLTFAELDAAATRLAWRLHAAHEALGTPLTADTAVGLCLRRGLGMMVAILGIMKAGGAYVPLDPDHPPERLAFLAEDCGARLIVTDTGLAGAVPVTADRLVLVDAENGAAPPCALPEPAPGDLAYILYTSGSTGTPKGAMIEHRALANRILWMQAAYPITPDDRVLQKTPFSFDVSVWEFVWPIVTGARLVFARPDGHRDPAYLARLIRERAITTLHFVPSMLRVFVETVDLARLTSLSRMFCSGEALPADLARTTLAALPALGLHNLYGPTEAAIDVSYHPCTADMTGTVVPIGLPVWNTALLVLDPAMRPVPVGVPGELWIGGVQLARGYRNRPELTAERFVPNPFGEGRLYRTGDRVVRAADGVLHYIGRTDFQVKVRGVRIEPGEVEAALESIPGVAQAVVTARAIRGETELVAHIATGGAPGDEEAVKAQLRASLPEAMVPTRFVWLDRLPLNTSGKVDRATLPAPQTEAAAERAQNEAPADATEAAIVAAMAEILGPVIHRNTDFFAAGGHSLHAVRLVARLGQRFGRSVSVGEVFALRTPAALADALRDPALLEAAAPAIRPIDRSAPLPVSFGQERLWLLDQMIADKAAYNVPLALRIAGPLDADALGDAFDALFARHEILRTRIVRTEGRLHQVVDPAEPFPLQMERTSEARLAERLGDLARTPFDLARDHPVRAHLLRLGAGEFVLLLNLHHSATDGWSQQLLLSELGRTYREIMAGTPPAADTPDLQYADLAAAERARLTGPRREALAAYWAATLEGAPALALPTDHPRPPRPASRGALSNFQVAPEVAASLRTLAQENGATPFGVFAALFQLFLARWTGTEDLVIATPVANRTHPAELNTLGLFMNTIAIRPGIAAPERPFAEAVAAAARAIAGAMAHEALPFDQILDAARVARHPDRPPLTPVMLIMQNPAEGEGFAAPGLAITPLPLDTQTAKFDLTLSFEEAGGGYAGTLEYDADLFDPATMEWVAQSMARLCARAAHSPAITAGALAEAINPQGARPAIAIGFDAGAPPAAPDQDNTAIGDAPETSVAQMEEIVADAWRRVLEIDRVERERNFFDLGGTSLRLMRVQALLSERLGREVEILTLFENPTLSQLAAILAAPAPDAAEGEADDQSPAARNAALNKSRQARRLKRTGPKPS
ncbi:non-ribosomal peptide synthetase [Acuticoccus kandeliae]|uniref:non-ribosomal peptide synthetase n=1 Tax=Acuticoccus kandeliae TaxID=2073160 RepID=UPI000D3E3419|nr:non-ribosomal peptide synthetase [Acuticoccus kandeliae]